MSIQHYIKEIGRGKDGARGLSREQACELMGLILDDQVSDLQIGAFCIAMRIKGESGQEMAGFLDAAHARLNHFRVEPSERPLIVIPSYNGARRLPVLTPLLAILLCQKGYSVLMHGSTSEKGRITSESVLNTLGYSSTQHPKTIAPGELVYAPTPVLSPSIQKLLNVRVAIGLRNSAHSMVKLLSPMTLCKSNSNTDPKSVLITSYTHPEYRSSMSETLKLTQSSAMLLRGCEGEPVADARRSPAYTLLKDGVITHQLDSEKGSVLGEQTFAGELSALEIAKYTTQILNRELAVPASILQQIDLIERFYT
jgi:anthranilate phosphoribosyltransferase